MNNNDTTFLQKIKDNAFYIALGVGILAIIAVIAVYTMGRDGGVNDDNEVDLNQFSEYSSITTERDSNTNRRQEKNTANSTDNHINTSEEDRMKSNNDETGNISDVKKASDNKTENEQVSEDSIAEDDIADTSSTEAVRQGDASEDGEQLPVTADVAEQLPVTADVGELNFSSDKTLTWPVSGEVILPYSMETTVYYKTLDQYRTNPGMLIAAGSGTTVKNAYLGKVVKVTSDNTYGNIVTIYIGNDYSLVYGQLDTIYVKEGDFVKAGESVGTIGKPTDSFEDEGNHLFFKMLKGDAPVDPMEFME